LVGLDEWVSADAADAAAAAANDDDDSLGRRGGGKKASETSKAWTNPIVTVCTHDCAKGPFLEMN
jgi:hypothetical protein